jgi:hypothetical protein
MMLVLSQKSSAEQLRVKAGKTSWPCVLARASGILQKERLERPLGQKNVARGFSCFAGQRPCAAAATFWLI